ncbi:MAG: hypothetical protein ABL984_08275 [Pyrinomonadaceae bacterium]
MNIFHLSISLLVFVSTLLLGTTAVIASRFVITTVAGFTKPAPARVNVVVPTAERERIVDLEDLRNEPPPQPDDFDATGSYSLIMDETPGAFADVGFVDITAREYSYANGIYASNPVIPSGTLHTNKWHVFTKVSIGNREISFETITEGGISYQFVGHFPVSSEYVTCQGCENPADLKGRLKKLNNGNVIAELDANFYAYRR